jgi:hypothetical protein
MLMLKRITDMRCVLGVLSKTVRVSLQQRALRLYER